MSKKVIVAHGGSAARGYRDVLEALQTALVAGADMFEFDVRRTGDGTLVVHHDDAIGGRQLAALEYAAAADEAGRHGYRLPLFGDVLELARGRLELDVELKETGCEEDVLRRLFDAGSGVDDFVITSFEPAALDRVRAADRRVRTGLLVYDVTGAEALDLFRRSESWLLGPDHQILDDATLAEAARASIPLLPWTVNDAPAMQRLLDASAVIGLITDNTKLALGVRDRRDRSERR
jgi:glycerophosphoryl diester phosphodiesterase